MVYNHQLSLSTDLCTNVKRKKETRFHSERNKLCIDAHTYRIIFTRADFIEFLQEYVKIAMVFSIVKFRLYSKFSESMYNRKQIFRGKMY